LFIGIAIIILLYLCLCIQTERNISESNDCTEFDNKDKVNIYSD